MSNGAEMEKKEKVGIISLYYRNHNYGGLLQAYALTFFLNKHNICAEEICWKSDPVNKNQRIVRSGPRYICREIVKKIILYFKKNKIKLRYKAMEEFEESIPHSRKVYNRKTINECNNIYEIFITGSDQVWNMKWYNPEFFLGFASDNKIKLSYAASMPNINLSENDQNLVHKSLSDFAAIAVREKDTFRKLRSILPNKDIQLTIDPTMLLEFADWEAFMDNSSMIPSDYVFCYFLSGKKNVRHMAKKFCKSQKLKMVTLPHLNSINIPDIGFGDIQLYDITPKQLLGLIRNAKYVLTDSFHVTVFSMLFKTPYFTFSRFEDNSMDSRIINLLYLRNCTDRFCRDGNVRLEYLLSIKDNTFQQPKQEYFDLVNFSRSFLLKHLVHQE